MTTKEHLVICSKKCQDSCLYEDAIRCLVAAERFDLLVELGDKYVAHTLYGYARVAFTHAGQVQKLLQCAELAIADGHFAGVTALRSLGEEVTKQTLLMCGHAANRKYWYDDAFAAYEAADAKDDLFRLAVRLQETHEYLSVRAFELAGASTQLIKLADSACKEGDFRKAIKLYKAAKAKGKLLDLADWWVFGGHATLLIDTYEAMGYSIPHKCAIECAEKAMQQGMNSEAVKALMHAVHAEKLSNCYQQKAENLHRCSDGGGGSRSPAGTART